MLRTVWQAFAGFFNLYSEPPKGRLSETEVEEIGRRGIGAVMAFVELGDGSFGGTVPKEIFARELADRYDGPVAVSLVEHWGWDGRLVWEVTTNVENHRGGHRKVIIDDASGKIITGAASPR